MTKSFRPADQARLEARRSRNMRQLLLRASRIVNRDVVAGLRARGHTRLRATHTTLLSNLDLEGSSVTEVAERAGITKQAMGRLASELALEGYLAIRSDLGDGRVRQLELTRAGQRLMRDSFEVMAELERGYAADLGHGALEHALRTLAAFVDQHSRERREDR
jgi:DNA-binding MarR family transcriptional regulator